MVFGLAAPVLNFGLPTYWMTLSDGSRMSRRFLVWSLTASWLCGVLILFAVPLPNVLLVLITGLLIGALASPYSEVLLYRAGAGSRVQTLRVIDVSSSGLCILLLWLFDALTVISATTSLFATTFLLRCGLLFKLSGRQSIGDAFPFIALRRNASDVLKAWSWDLMVVFSASIDLLIGAWFLSRSDLGLYAVAVAIGRLSGAAFSATSPLVVTATASGQSARQTLMRLTALPAMISLSAVVVFAAVGEVLVSFVYGPAYAAIAPTATVLIAGAAVSGLIAHLEAVAFAGVRYRNSPIPRILSALFVLGSCLMLQRYGDFVPFTLALSSGVGTLIALSFTLISMHRRVRGVHRS
jgi:O-antigen/teichoic acid export membrane protein